MWGSAVVYSGAIVAVAGLVLAIKPIRRLRVTTRARGLIVAVAGVLLAAIGLVLPVSESRVGRIETRLDEFVPAWQFREIHTIRVAAPPRARVRGHQARACGRDSSVSHTHVDSTRRPRGSAEHPERRRLRVAHRCRNIDWLSAPGRRCAT